MQLLGKWKSIVLAGLVTTALPAEITAENSSSEAYYPQSSCYQGCGYFGLSAEVLFLQYCRDSLVGFTEGSGDVELKGDYLKHNLEPGFRLIGSWSPDPCSRLAQLELTYLKTSKTVERSGEIAGFFIPFTGSLATEEDIDYALVDAFYYFHEGQFGACGDVALALGFRWLKHDAKINERYCFDDGESIFKEDFSLSSDTNGYGLSFRLESTRSIFDCWNLKAQFGGSVLCASTKGKWDYITEDVFVDWGSRKKAIGSFEGALKIARPFNCMCRDFLFFAGVEATHWIGLGQYQGVQEGDLELGRAEYFSDNVTLWGFSLGLAGQF